MLARHVFSEVGHEVDSDGFASEKHAMLAKKAEMLAENVSKRVTGFLLASPKT